MTGDALIAGLIDHGPMVVIVGAMLAGLVMVLAVADAIGSPARRKRKRLESLHVRLKAGPRARPAMNVQLKRDTKLSDVPILDRFLRQFLPRPEKLRLRLSRTGLKINLGTYALFNAVLLVGTMLACLVSFKLSPLTSVLIAVLVGLGLPHFVIGFMIARRQKKFLGLFPEAIDLMVRGLRSGLPITETVVTVGREMNDPVGTEFRQMAESVRLGETLEEAVWQAVERTGLSELNFFVTALSVQRETGGNLTETLDNLSDVLRKRRQLKLKIKAISAEARASATIISALPFVMFCIIYLLNTDYVMKLFIDPRGMYMVGAGLFLMVVGILAMIKMVRFEV
ncbi:MAG: type II secretion system F family protein [Kiloniellales bacterium]